MSKKIWIAGVLTLAVALVAAGAVSAAPAADPQTPGSGAQGPQGQPGPDGRRGRGGAPQVSGEITAIGEDQFTVQLGEGAEVSVTVSDATAYFGSLNSFSALAVGDEVVVAGMPNGQGKPDAADAAPDSQEAPNDAPNDAQGQRPARSRSLTASLIALSDELSLDNRSGGELTAITSGSLTLETRDGESLSFTVNADTIFVSHDGALQSISDLQTGDQVQIIYAENGSTQTAVMILAGGAPKGGGQNGPQNDAPPQDGSAPDSSQGIDVQG